jgi:hypothetical protein
MRASCAILFGLAVFCLLTPIIAQGADNPAVPAPSNSAATAPDPLLQLLVSKGVLNAEEAKSLSGTPEQQRARLLELLRQKGVLSASDYDSLTTPSASSQVAPNLIASTTPILPAALATSAPPEPKPAAPAGPAVIPAVAPLRVAPIDVPKQGGIIPDLKLGSGASIKVYGFYKASAVSDTASSGGPTFGSQDWPLPLLLADTGPTSDPQVHIKARQFRIGAQTEWVPKGSDFTITGRVEGDFEGDYTDVNNRNISGSARSQFSLRLAWVRLDHKIGDLPWFAEFGEDWSLVGSSTLPSLFETTGLGVGMGSLYERMPLFKTGVQFHSGDFKVQPEFGIVMPTAGTSSLTVDQRLRFGDRAGAEANQPGLEARVVFQFPLSHSWKGVAPAQIIFSGHHARMNEIIPHATQTVATPFTFTPTCTTNGTTVTCTPVTVPVPTIFTNVTSQNVGFTPTTILNASNCPATGTCNLASIFSRGTQVGNPQNIYTAELQLPTPWVTFVGKVYRGNDIQSGHAGLGRPVESPYRHLGKRTNHLVRLRRRNLGGYRRSSRRELRRQCSTSGNPHAYWRKWRIRGVEFSALAHLPRQSGRPQFRVDPARVLWHGSRQVLRRCGMGHVQPGEPFGPHRPRHSFAHLPTQ